MHIRLYQFIYVLWERERETHIFLFSSISEENTEYFEYFILLDIRNSYFLSSGHILASLKIFQVKWNYKMTWRENLVDLEIKYENKN